MDLVQGPGEPSSPRVPISPPIKNAAVTVRFAHSRHVIRSDSIPSKPLAQFLHLAAANGLSHYAHIPERICRCMDGMNFRYDRNLARERLLKYHIFLGVIDEVLDSQSLARGESVLEYLQSPLPQWSQAMDSPIRLVSEVLKTAIPLDTYRSTLRRLERLYAAVVAERFASDMSAYSRVRQRVGCLSAEISYRLIEPLVDARSAKLRRFLRRVGQVGCLVDSAIDGTSDYRRGLLRFKPTLADRLRLFSQIVRVGAPIAWTHPRAIGTFVQAIGDDLRDRHRSRERLRREIISDTVVAADTPSPSTVISAEPADQKSAALRHPVSAGSSSPGRYRRVS